MAIFMVHLKDMHTDTKLPEPTNETKYKLIGTVVVWLIIVSGTIYNKKWVYEGKGQGQTSCALVGLLPSETKLKHASQTIP